MPDPRDAELSRLRREVAALRERENTARDKARDARKNFADLTAMSKRFASSMRVGAGERHQQRRNLAAQYAVSRMLAGARDLDEAAPKVYEILGERLGWHAGALWKLEESSAVLRRAGAWRSSNSSRGVFDAAGEDTVFRRGEGLPGRVWERCTPVWVEDFPDEAGDERTSAAAEDGLRGALAFPIIDGSFVGVFELFHREVLPPDEGLMRTAELVGGQIAQFLERRRAEEERDRALVRERGARERATSILESINDAFYALDEEQRFTYVNRRAEGIWGRTREELLGRNIWEVFPEAIGLELYQALEKVLREGEAAEYEALSVVLGVWISGRVYPSPGGVSVLFHSIEERKKAEGAAFRTALADALRPLEDPVEIQSEAVRVLGRHLGSSRAFYAEIEPDDDHFLVAAEFTSGVPGMPRRHRLQDFGPEMVARIRAGRNLVVSDTEANWLTRPEREALAAVAVRAHVHVPLAKGGRSTAFLSVHQSEPRAWTADEVALVEETAERTWAAVERARAQKALRARENRYRSLVTATSSIVWSATAASGFVEEMPSWEEYTGQTFEDHRGFGWLDAVHPGDRTLANAWTRADADEAPVESEFRLRRRDGEYRRVVSRGVPIPDGDGPREWVGVILDVEDNRRAEEEREDLRHDTEEEWARLQTILRQMPGGIFVANSSGRLVIANEGARRIYQKEIGSAEECGRRSLSYPGGEELSPEAWPLVRALKGEAVSGMEYYVVRPDGEWCVIRANSAPVLDGEGKIVAAVEAFEDITGRKEAERERDRSRGREREARTAVEKAERRLAFYAGAREERQVISRELHDRVAHSIAVVRQSLELYEVLRDRNPEAAAKKMDLAKQEATASLKSTRDLSMMLRHSEVEEGIVRALEALGETTVPMGVRYGSTVTGDESLVPPHVGNQVFLVLREAVRNAVNHAGCGSVAVELKITNERVIGTVEDDGRGFETDGAGDGGGLRSMEERASLVGGTFRLRSGPGEGSKVEVMVPLMGGGPR